MLEQLHEIAEKSKTENPYFSDSKQKQLLSRVEKGHTSPEVLLQLSLAELDLGMERDAIKHLEQAALLAQKSVTSGPSKTDILYWLGVANFRLAETENCCARNTPDSCLLPIQGGGIHTKEEGSRNAIRLFEKVLQDSPRNSENYVRARWLLNIAYMTLDEYPAKVPPSYLVNPSYFNSGEGFPKFPNSSKKLGIDTLSCAGGAIVDDFDNDGDFDLIVSDSDPAGPLKFYRNQGDKGFVDDTKAANLTGLFGGLSMVQTDYNNDGWLDIFITRGGWFKGNGMHPNSLLRNNKDGTFSDVTIRAGLAEVNTPTQASSWADYDLDGDLDLYIGNERHTHDPPSQLFRNNGDETFTDVAAEAGVTNDRFAKAVIWGDYNNDRWPDIYVSNFGSKNRLYKNNGDGTFTDVAAKLKVDEPKVSFPCWFWDFDNDGQLDLYVSSYDAHMDDIAADAMGFTLKRERAKLYKNNNGKFTDVAKEMGIDGPSTPMGANFGDINGDGFLDFYLGTGWPPFDELTPNQMFVSKAGKSFEDVTMQGGFGHLQKGHAVVFADLDQDGDQDVFEEMGGAVKGDQYYNALFENPGFDTNWISIKLEGVQTNRAAIGARIHLVIDENGQERSIYKHVNSGGSFGANPLTQNIGIAKATTIKILEVFWPVSNTTQTFTDVLPNQSYHITEGVNALENKNDKTE